jgi:hypothetical protein
MKLAGVVAIVAMLSACAQLRDDPPPLSVSGEARCAEFGKIANDMTTTAYRRATAVEQLRAQRCPGYQ